MRTAMKGLSPNAMALQNIQQLKGYCVAAIDQALDMLEQHKTAKLSALVNLIAEFGADAASKELVVEYGQMMNKLKAGFDSKGLPIYLLDHLDQAVLSGEGIISTTGAKARFNSEELGFQEEPEYIESLEVSLSDYTSAWTTVASASSGADDQAALECLQAGTIQKYSTFLDQIKAKYAQKAQEYWEQVVKGAESAEADAFDSTSTLDDQSPAGLGGAAAVVAELEGKEGGSGGGMQMPSDEEINAEAEKMAKDWASGNLKARCADVVEDVDELETGEVVECKMIEGSYGSDAETVVTADKGKIKASFGDDTGNQMHGSVDNETDTTCTGTAHGLQTSMDGDADTAHKFSYDDATHTITWEDGSVWTKYTPPADDGTSAPVSPPAEEACKAYVLCAAEHGTCSFEGSKTVRYGLNGQYKEAVHSDGVACTNGVFGDPIVGTVKSCFVQEEVPCDGSWSFCTEEGGTCSFSGTKMVRYGALKGADEFWYAKEATGSIACTNGAFGDPLVGTKKACYTFESESLSSEPPSEAPSTDEASPTAPTCPEGTEQVGDINADIPGCGLQGCGERYAIDTIEDCQSACAANSDCVAFTWAPIGGDRNHMDQSACTQYDSAVPTSTWGPNQIFCKPSWHLSAGATTSCDSGIQATQAECEAAVASLAADAGTTPGRALQLGSGGSCGDGGWGGVPSGCVAQSLRGGDWAAHFKTSGPNCNNGYYQVVCSGTGT
jgi:hypothetical protein